MHFQITKILKSPAALASKHKNKVRLLLLHRNRYLCMVLRILASVVKYDFVIHHISGIPLAKKPRFLQLVNPTLASKIYGMVYLSIIYSNSMTRARLFQSATTNGLQLQPLSFVLVAAIEL